MNTLKVIAGDFPRGKYAISTPEVRAAAQTNNAGPREMVVGGTKVKLPATDDALEEAEQKNDFSGLIRTGASSTDTAKIPFSDFSSVDVVDETYVNHQGNGGTLWIIALILGLVSAGIGYFLGSNIVLGRYEHMGMSFALSIGVSGAMFGAIIGALMGDKQKNVTFSVSLKDGKRSLVMTDSQTFIKIKSAVF